MSLFAVENQSMFKNKRILELGAGCGLPGFILEKLGAANVTLSDILTPAYYDKITACISLNNSKNVKLIDLVWGELDQQLALKVRNCFDIIIGSDLFYDSKLFEDLIATVAFILYHNPSCSFITAYQERSARRNIAWLLERWDLSCRLIEQKEDIYDRLNAVLQLKTLSGVTEICDPAIASVHMFEFRLKSAPL
jgi:hypothetical protein